MEKEALQRSLALLMKPLVLAARDGFSRVESVRGLENLVERICSETLKGAEGLRRAKISELRTLFRGFDGLERDEKVRIIEKALDLIGAATGRPAGGREAARRLGRLSTPVKFVKGVGPNLARRLESKGIRTVEDLLYFLPARYEDRTKVSKISALCPGESALATGEIMVSGEVRYGRRKTFEAVLGDGTGLLVLKWFNYRPAYMKRYVKGRRLIVWGRVSRFGGRLEMVHPDTEFMEEEERTPEGIVPVYSHIEGLHQKTVRKIVRAALEDFSDAAVSGVPWPVLARLGLMPLGEALLECHFPQKLKRGTPEAERSLFFDEFFQLELGLALKKRDVKKERGLVTLLKGAVDAEKRLREGLSFRLTGAQERALLDIKKDMASPHPMNRLLQGDVGSGKTVVSIMAALWAVASGFQAAVMAPTEILAEQHYLTTRALLEPLGTRVILFTGGLGAARRGACLDEVRSGSAQVVIGTHSLIQKDVSFKNLGLAVIDEQHRFGVVQRGKLKEKGPGDIAPDILIMTATPIPRTLSMTVYGELDVSIIDELPPGRRPVETRLLNEKQRERAYEIIRREVKAGGQAYIVYPLVEESVELSLRDATNMKGHLERDVFREFRLGLLHGRMKPAEKEAVMRAFKEKRLHILVATTVIEVGVDVPDATVMLIEHAERFGLSQLHQLRGRIGRGRRRSVCLLLAGWTNSPQTRTRLRVMEETTDGFRIAEEDLKLRGPGDFVGERQSGLPDFRFASALAETALLRKAREEAFSYLEKNPGLEGPEGEVLREVLRSRWKKRLKLAEIG